MVEQPIRNRQVPGSSPGLGSIRTLWGAHLAAEPLDTPGGSEYVPRIHMLYRRAIKPVCAAQEIPVPSNPKANGGK